MSVLYGGIETGGTKFVCAVGTGIGGGGMVNRQLMHGLIHHEIGHVRIPHDRDADPFAGACPFHGDCLEGLAAVPALELRWRQSPETLPPDHPAWALEAHYLALGLANFICTLSPQCVIIGGGVMEQAQLLPMIRGNVHRLLNGYIRSPEILSGIDGYIVPPSLSRRWRARSNCLGISGTPSCLRCQVNFMCVN